MPRVPPTTANARVKRWMPTTDVAEHVRQKSGSWRPRSLVVGTRGPHDLAAYAKSPGAVSDRSLLSTTDRTCSRQGVTSRHARSGILSAD